MSNDCISEKVEVTNKLLFHPYVVMHQLRKSSALPKTERNTGLVRATTLDKKRTIRKISGEKNAVPSSDIMLDDARSAQGSRGLSRA